MLILCLEGAFFSRLKQTRGKVKKRDGRGGRLTGSVVNVIIRIHLRLLGIESEALVDLLDRVIGKAPRGRKKVVMRDHGQQDPHLKQPEALPVATVPVDVPTNGHASPRRNGRYVAGEEGGAEYDVWFGRQESDVHGGRFGVG